jgi:hypothetical protein
MHGVRVLLPVTVVALVVAAIVAVFSARPDIQQAKRRVDASWGTLSPQLDQRYALLQKADTATLAIPGPVHQVAADVQTGLTRWQAVRTHGSVRDQVAAANALEGLGRRLLATAVASPRAAQNAPAKAALEAYVANQAVATAADFNATVASYARERQGPVRTVVANMLGDGDIPALDTTGTPA